MIPVLKEKLQTDNTAQTKEIRKSISMFENKQTEMKESNIPYSNNAYHKLKIDIIEDLKNKIYNLDQEEIVQHEQVLKEYQQAYNKAKDKDSTRRLADIESMRLKYSSMTDSELNTEISNIQKMVAENDFVEFQKSELDIITLEIKDRGDYENHKDIREIIKKHNIDKPFLAHGDALTRFNRMNDLKRKKFGFIEYKYPNQNQEMKNHSSPIDACFE